MEAEGRNDVKDCKIDSTLKEDRGGSAKHGHLSTGTCAQQAKAHLSK